MERSSGLDFNWLFNEVAKFAEGEGQVAARKVPPRSSKETWM